MKPAVAIVLAFLVFSIPVQGASVVGTALEGDSGIYRVAIPHAGSLVLEMTWAQNHSDGFLLVLCSTDGGTSAIESSAFAMAPERRGGASLRLDVFGGGATKCTVGAATLERKTRFQLRANVYGPTGARLQKANPLRLERQEGPDPAIEAMAQAIRER